MHHLPRPIAAVLGAAVAALVAVACGGATPGELRGELDAAIDAGAAGATEHLVEVTFTQTVDGRASDEISAVVQLVPAQFEARTGDSNTPDVVLVDNILYVASGDGWRQHETSLDMNAAHTYAESMLLLPELRNLIDAATNISATNNTYTFTVTGPVTGFDEPLDVTATLTIDNGRVDSLELSGHIGQEGADRSYESAARYSYDVDTERITAPDTTNR